MILFLFKVTVALMLLPLRIARAILSGIFAARRLPDGSRVFPSFKRVLFRLALTFSAFAMLAIVLKKVFCCKNCEEEDEDEEEEANEEASCCDEDAECSDCCEAQNDSGRGQNARGEKEDKEEKKRRKLSPSQSGLFNLSFSPQWHTHRHGKKRQEHSNE